MAYRVLMTSERPIGRRYPKGAARRQQILDEAVEVFARAGFRSGSLREIAKRVNLTPTGVMHYFSSKEELFTEVIAERDNRVEQAAGTAEDETQPDQMRAVVAHNAANRGLSSLFTVVTAEATAPDHPAHEHFAERYRTNAAESAQALAAAQRRGLVRSDIDPAHAARLITAVMDGLQLAWLLDDTVDMPATFEEFLRGYLLPDESPDADGVAGPTTGDV